MREDTFASLNLLVANMGVLLAGIYVMGGILRKGFGQFRILLVEVGRSTTTTPGVTFIDPRLGHTLRIWWAIWWRFVLWAVVVILPVSLVIDIIGGTFLGIPGNVRFKLGYFVVGPVVTFLVALYVLRGLLRKDFRKFRVRLICQ